MWEVLQAGCTQLRVGGMGGTIGFDYNALKLIADAYFVETTRAFWRKVQAVENVIRRIETKQQERDRQRTKTRKR